MWQADDVKDTGCVPYSAFDALQKVGPEDTQRSYEIGRTANGIAVFECHPVHAIFHADLDPLGSAIRAVRASMYGIEAFENRDIQ
jgi:hypothetical protein